MEPIVIKVNIDHSGSIPKEFLGYTAYDLLGQGTIETVKDSVEAVISDYLSIIFRSGHPLPEPRSDFSVKGFMLEERVERHYEGLTSLIFEYYRRPQN